MLQNVAAFVIKAERACVMFETPIILSARNAIFVGHVRMMPTRSSEPVHALVDVLDGAG